MATKAVDVRRSIPDPYKEAVVDSILNNLSARVSGTGEFHRVISNTRPSDLLVSGFLVPRPEELRDSDEETSPLQINAHGIDFHAATEGLRSPIRIKLRASVYVRVFPSAADVGPYGPLRPEFHFLTGISQTLRTGTYQAMDALRAELGVERFKESSHPDWARRLLELRKRVHTDMGLPFNEDDLADTKPSPRPDDVGPQAEEGENRPEEQATRSAGGRRYGNDDLYQEAKLPQKWLRLDLEIPGCQVVLSDINAGHLSILTDQLNEAIAERVKNWLESSGKHSMSEHVAYKAGAKVLPSHLNNWQAFLDSACRDDKPFARPEFNVQWAISARPDPLKEGRSLVHVAIENWSQYRARQRNDLELSLFNVRMSIEIPKGILVPLLLDRVKPSYRYNQYLEYPALGVNCGVMSRREQDRDLLSTTWSPRYTLPRIDPSDVPAERGFAELAQPDGVDRLVPLVKSFRQWITDTRANTRVDAGLSGPEAAQLLEGERQKLEADLVLWGKECDAIDRGVRLLLESRRHWSGPGPQSDPMGAPFEAWLTMNAAMAQVGKGKYDSWRLLLAGT